MKEKKRNVDFELEEIFEKSQIEKNCIYSSTLKFSFRHGQVMSYTVKVGMNPTETQGRLLSKKQSSRESINRLGVRFRKRAETNSDTNIS